MPQSSLDHLDILETPLVAELQWPDEAACARSARLLARVWTVAAHGVGDPAATSQPLAGSSFASAGAGTLTLHGPLGAGKTAFTRHLLQALGVKGRIKSPTYTLVEPYEVMLPGGPLVVAHCDLYRFENPVEWEDAGLRDLFSGPALRVVEWPSRAGDRLGRVDLELHIEPVAEALALTSTDAAEPTEPPPLPRRCRAVAWTSRGATWLPYLSPQAVSPVVAP